MKKSANGAFRERVHVFGRDSSLCGIICYPVGQVLRIPVLILGAGIIHKVGPSRVSVDFARILASAGHPVMRFDLSGIGDSPRASEARLEDAVAADVRDATSVLLEAAEGWAGGVCLTGFCSGADNAFYLAPEDRRVEAIVLFDPTVHPTRGFRRRRLLQRLGSARSWLNILSGRSMWLRIRDHQSSQERSPDYYGLLVTTADDTDESARTLVRRGVKLLYILSGDVKRYCNSPHQVAESMPTGYSSQHFSIRWQPGMDHLLSGSEQREEFSRLVTSWLVGLVEDSPC